MTDQANKPLESKEVVNETTMAAPVQGETSPKGQPTTNTDVPAAEASVPTKDGSNPDKGEAYKDKAREVTEELEKSRTEEDIEDELVIKPQNIDAQFPVFINEPHAKGEKETISLPSAFPGYITAKVNNAPNVNLSDNESSVKWARTVNAGTELVTIDNIYREALEKEDSQWQQAIDANGVKLMGSAPGMTKVSGEALTGERATLRFLKFAGLGSIFSIPLWHTGIWITIKTPSEARLLELSREMIDEKIMLGRSTHGLALSAVNSVYAEKLVKLAMDHIYSTNIKTDKNLLDVISCHDIDTIIWGLACSIWNNGFQYSRGCTHDPEKCQHIVEEKIDVSKLLWVNKTALTPWQIAHMARRKQSEVTLEEVDRYQKELLSSQPKQITVELPSNGNKFNINLKVPTINEYIERSNDWIQSVVDSVERALTVDPTDEDRNKFINENARTTLMRQYGHWVESIVFDENQITDKETIDTQLEWLSSVDEIRNTFTDEIRKYINESAVSVIGIPSFTCPKCGGEQKYTAKNNSLYSIIPLDMINTFFYLHVQRAYLIRNR